MCFIPDVFNLYTECIMSAIEEKEGFIVGGYNWNNIRCADDTALIADSTEMLQEILNTVVEESAVKGLSVNQKKTFCIAISKKVNCALEILGQRIQQVNKLNYLGSTIYSDSRCANEIKRRIARETFQRMSKILESSSIQ